jgi:hypothetical protein
MIDDKNTSCYRGADCLRTDSNSPPFCLPHTAHATTRGVDSLIRPIVRNLYLTGTNFRLRPKGFLVSVVLEELTILFR